jgi:hypothetical protein
MTQHLTRKDLMSLEEYAEARPDFRKKVMAQKKDRALPIGPNATLYFEDALTMQYQIQEMLRIERVFEPAGIQEELDVYNPLIPDGTNWKATFMLEYEDVEERQKRLAELTGIEEKTWVRVGDHDKVFAIANEDLERTAEGKTSSVHFLRFELTPEMIRDAKAGAEISAGTDHPAYAHQATAPENVRASLVKDLR